ncbi:hypothetical protein BGZ82_006814 [Podila clonocystis]|nr:hypothetical protein BGZ82_006814 [Podila clonocystis]
MIQNDPSWGPAFVAIEGKALYVQGGQSSKILDFTNIPQTFAIDLSKPWDVIAPVYSKMANGIPDYQHPSALLKDSLSWLILAKGTIYTYNLATGTITDQTTVPEAISGQGFSAVTNPLSNSFFVPNGYNNSGIQSSLEYSPNGSPKATSIAAYPPLAGYRFYAMARSNYANAAFVFGGNRWDSPRTSDSALTDIFLRFSFQDRNWTPVYTMGGPSARDSSCMASAYNGAKLVVFGGIENAANSLSDIFVYDVASNTWTQGEAGGVRRARASPACTVSGDFFIAYGGYSDKASRNPPVELTSVYNLKTNKWVARYELPAESSGLSAGGIAGCVIGGVAVMACVVLFVLYRRERKGKKETVSQQSDPTVPECRVETPKKEEDFPLMVQHVGMSMPVDPYASQKHESQLNIQMDGRSVQEWPTSELRGPQLFKWLYPTPAPLPYNEAIYSILLLALVAIMMIAIPVMAEPVQIGASLALEPDGASGCREKRDSKGAR